jgi:hypothetical protein
MPNYIQDIMARLVAMEKESLATVAASNNQTPDAVAFWPYEQESFPYFTNRLGAMNNNQPGYATEIQDYQHTILIRLVVAHWESGFEGDKADIAYQYLVAFEDYFRKHPMLTTDPTGLYPDDPDYLFEEMVLSGHTGLIVFQNTGINAFQYGIEFTLVLPYLRDAED